MQKTKMKMGYFVAYSGGGGGGGAKKIFLLEYKKNTPFKK
jgi:hypothetical protein